MNISDAIRQRYSVRGYRPEPVPDELVREVFEIARLAPSGSNIQPWHVAVVSGAARDALEVALCEDVDCGKTQDPGFPRAEIDGVYRDRRRACGFGYYATMGVERDDTAGRNALARKNFEFFGAPHVAFFSMPRTMERINAVDVGIFLQTVMLVMVDKGLGCIPQGALAGYPDRVRAIAHIPADNEILCGLSFGYEDPTAPINEVRMPRESLDAIASFTS